ncbi:hypothetical protein LEMLEM_LOCUS592 [Lemmus lemmus]
MQTTDFTCKDGSAHSRRQCLEHRKQLARGFHGESRTPRNSKSIRRLNSPLGQF